MLRRPGKEAVLTSAALALLPHARGLISSAETALAALSVENRGVILSRRLRHPAQRMRIERIWQVELSCFPTRTESSLHCCVLGSERRYRGPRLESVGGTDGVKRGVRNGDCIGVLPDYAAAEDLAAGNLFELKVRDPLPAVAVGLTMQRRPFEASPLHEMIQQIECAIVATDLPA